MLFSASTAAFSIPQFTVLTGNRCSNCHVAPSGGGQRTYLGWYSLHDVGVIPPESSAISWLYPEDPTNSYFDDMLMLGMNLRLQSTRSFANEDATRATFPMQLALYGAFQPVKALTVEGGFNFAALRQAPNSTATIRYPGQRSWSASAIFAPSPLLPTFRAGFFRPGYGLRYDDHTTFPVSYISGVARLNYLAPDWAEYGGEITYEGDRTLTLSGGVFGSEGLSQLRLNDGEQTVSAVSGNAPTFVFKAIAWPRWFDGDLNTYVGGSALVNGDFSMLNAVGGLGLIDQIYVMMDLTITTKQNVQSSMNFMTEVGWNGWEPVIIYGRYEHGKTDQARLSTNSSANSGVVGAQIFLIPYVELRPEYRLFDTSKEGVATRWNVQLHIFY